MFNYTDCIIALNVCIYSLIPFYHIALLIRTVKAVGYRFHF